MSYRTDGSSALDDWDDSDFSGDSALDDQWTNEASGTDYGKIIQFPGSNSGDSDRGMLRNARKESAKKKALDGEKKASGLKGAGGDDKKGKVINLTGANGNGIMAAKDAESVDGKNEGFANKVAGKAAAKAVPGGQMVVNKLKKMGPFGTILIIVAACLGMFTASQSMAPFGLINNLTENYNALKTSMNTRSRSSMMTRLIKGGKNTSIIKTSLFGKKNFKFSKKTQAKLAKNGIYFDPDTRTLWHTDSNTGKTYGVSADEGTKSTIPDSVEITAEDGTVMKFTADPDGGKLSYQEIMDSDATFFQANERSTRTLKGHIAGWFDSISQKFHERIGNSRNRQATTSLGADTDEIESHARDGGMSEEARDNGDTSVDSTTDQDKPATDPSRDVETEVDTKGKEGSLTKGMSESDVKTSLTARAKSVAAALGTAANVLNVASYACVAIKVVNSLIQTIQALSKAQVLNFGTGMFESIQKAEIGDSSTEMHFYMNKGTEPDEAGTTMFGSPAIAQAFSDGKELVSPNDPLAQEVSTVHISNSIMKGGGGFTGKVLDGIQSFGGSLKTYKGCVQLQAVSGVLGVASDIASIAAGIMSGGISALIQTLLRSILKAVALQAIIAGIMSIVTGTLVPYVAKMLVRDLIDENTKGAILGYAADSAANMYMGEQMQSATGLPGTETSILAQYQETQRVIAEDARFDRETKSPFDITSKHTFFGSIVNSLTPIAMSVASPSTIISNMPTAITRTTSLVGDSVASLLPTAQAIGVVNFKTSLSHDCGSLSNVVDPETGEELVCDAYGNPYFITRLDTMGNDAADVMDNVATYLNRTTIKHWVCNADKSSCYEVTTTELLEETNFVKGYYGDFDNFPGQIEQMKKDGYYYRDSNYDGSDDMFYLPKNGAFRILRKENGDDGETADVVNPEIREHSELANYIVSCEIRETGYGQEDSQISAYVNSNTASQKMGTLLNSLVGSIPIVGNLIQLRDTSIEANNVEWVSGENCLKPAFKLYSRYSEDQRVLEAAQVLGDSAVAHFLDGYYEQNPIDNSTEGIIARYSGMSREDVDTVLGIVEYTTFVANYDATELGPVWQPAPTYEYVYESETIIADAMPEIIKNEYVIYDTLRNRVTVG